MDFKLFVTVMSVVFLAELGDKTQLATVLFAADREVSKWLVFAAASMGLILATAIGVLAGGLIAQYVNEKYLHMIAGIGFVAIGIWLLLGR